MKLPPIYTEALVCYDIQSDKKRKKMAEALKDIGLIHIQHSVFGGYTTLANRKSIINLFKTLLDATTDKAFLLPGKARACILSENGFGYTKELLPEYSDYGTL